MCGMLLLKSLQSDDRNQYQKVQTKEMYSLPQRTLLLHCLSMPDL